MTPEPRVRPVLPKLCPRRKRGGRREGRATHSSRSWGSPGADARLSKAPQSPRGAGGLLVSRGASPAPAATWLGRGRSNVTLLLGSMDAGGCGSLPWPSAFCFQIVAQRRTVRWRLWAACNRPPVRCCCARPLPTGLGGGNTPDPPAPAAGRAAAAGRPSCPPQSAGGARRPP